VLLVNVFDQKKENKMQSYNALLRQEAKQEIN
jgi:hypothetical protein